MSDELEQFKREIATLRRQSDKGRSKPHKPALLLAVLDLADDGLLTENKILFNSALFDRFARYFEAARQGNDWSQIAPPFFHLRSSPFWCHKVKEGREEIYATFESSGGGFKRITDNIEFSYLSDYAFAAVSDPKTRTNLRDFIVALFSPETAERMKTVIQNEPQKLGTAFHESFRLVRPVLKEVLRVVSESGDKKPNFDTFRQNSQIGTNYIKATRRYAFGANLLDSREKLTDFGRTVYVHDAGLTKIETLWMLHYFLAAPHGNGPLFWNELVANYFHSDKEISSEDVKNDIGQTAQSLGGDLAERTKKTTTTIFLGTYTEADSLGGLKILRKAGDGRYAVNEEFAARGLGVVACALGDFWAARFGDTKKVNLGEVTGAGGLAPLLLMSPGELQRALAELQARGVLSLERATPPFQIARGWEQPAALWEQLYEG